MWNITQIDTLSDLMNSANGEWDPTLVSSTTNSHLECGGR
jgi:hypothetical protein